MTHATALASLLACMPLREADEIGAYMGGDFTETLNEIRHATMCGGLSRDRLLRLVRDRAFVLTGLESLAECVSHVVAPLVPLAASMADVDHAVHAVGDWLADLAEDGVYDRIVELKRAASEAGLDDGPMDSDPAAIDAWNELFDAFCEDCEAGQVAFEMGGRDVLITIEEDATLVIVETTPGSGDLEILIVFAHRLGDGDDRDDDDPEDDPTPDPARPELLDA